MASCTKHGEWPLRFFACPKCFKDGDVSQPIWHLEEHGAYPVERRSGHDRRVAKPGSGPGLTGPYAGTAYIYINHVIRTYRPTAPVVRVQNEDGTYEEGNTALIKGPSIVRYDPAGLPPPLDRRVTAWVEARREDVTVQ